MDRVGELAVQLRACLLTAETKNADMEIANEAYGDEKDFENWADQHGGPVGDWDKARRVDDLRGKLRSRHDKAQNDHDAGKRNDPQAGESVAPMPSPAPQVGVVSADPDLLDQYPAMIWDTDMDLSGTAGTCSIALKDLNDPRAGCIDDSLDPEPLVRQYLGEHGKIVARVRTVSQLFRDAGGHDPHSEREGPGLVVITDPARMKDIDQAMVSGEEDPDYKAQMRKQMSDHEADELAAELTNAWNQGDTARVKELLTELRDFQDDGEFNRRLFSDLGPDRILNYLDTIKNDDKLLELYDTALATATRSGLDSSVIDRIQEPRAPQVDPNWDLILLLRYGTYSKDFLVKAGSRWIHLLYDLAQYNDAYAYPGRPPSRLGVEFTTFLEALTKNSDAAAAFFMGDDIDPLTADHWDPGRTNRLATLLDAAADFSNSELHALVYALVSATHPDKDGPPALDVLKFLSGIPLDRFAVLPGFVPTAGYPGILAKIYKDWMVANLPGPNASEEDWRRFENDTHGLLKTMMDTNGHDAGDRALMRDIVGGVAFALVAAAIGLPSKVGLVMGTDFSMGIGAASPKILPDPADESEQAKQESQHSVDLWLITAMLARHMIRKGSPSAPVGPDGLPGTPIEIPSDPEALFKLENKILGHARDYCYSNAPGTVQEVSALLWDTQ